MPENEAGTSKLDELAQLTEKYADAAREDGRVARDELVQHLASMLGVSASEVYVTKLKPAGTHNNVWQGEGNTKPKRIHVLVDQSGNESLDEIIRNRLHPKTDAGFEAIAIVSSEGGAPQLTHVVQLEGGAVGAELKKLFPAAELREVKSVDQLPYDEQTIVETPSVELTTQEVIQHLREAKNVVLQGPPGSGKTRMAMQVATALAQGADLESLRLSTLVGCDLSTEEGRAALEALPIVWEIVQLHPAYSYDDFVRGMKTDPSKSPFGVKHVDGILLQIAKVASYRSGPTLIILDELNRCNLPAVLGEMTFAIDASHRGTPVRLSSGKSAGASASVSIPAGLLILGTMNSADRSIALLDFAVRRRFRFLTVPSSPQVIDEHYGVGSVAATKARGLFESAMVLVPQRDLCPGHSYFLVPPPEGSNLSEWAQQLADKIMYELGPLIREYVEEGLVSVTPSLRIGDDLEVAFTGDTDAAQSALVAWLLLEDGHDAD